MTYFKPHSWSDNDRYLGPFTFSIARSGELGLVLCSGDGDEYAGCHLRAHVSRLSILCALPAFVLRPWRKWVEFKYAPLEAHGDGYWQTGRRQFGFVFSENTLHTYFGNQADEWPGCKSKVFFNPWTSWRTVRREFLAADGKSHAVIIGCDWDAMWKAKDTCPLAAFTFKDFDGEEITANCLIEITEQKRGEGRWKWLSAISRRRIDWSLDIKFSSEVGRRKGSWKGGTIGHSIDMAAGETHESAFRRYCEKHGLTFVGKATP